MKRYLGLIGAVGFLFAAVVGNPFQTLAGSEHLVGALEDCTHSGWDSMDCPSQPRMECPYNYSVPTEEEGEDLTFIPYQGQTTTCLHSKCMEMQNWAAHGRCNRVPYDSGGN
jgi:hypothetical protein